MFEWLEWFTRMENSKVIALLLFFLLFCGIVLYVYSGRSRGERLESYKYIPFEEDEEKKTAPVDDKVKRDGTH